MRIEDQKRVLQRDLVDFLEEQQALYDPQIFEPVVMTRRENIIIGDRARIDSFVKLEGGEGLRIGRFVHIASFAHVNIGGGNTLIDDFAAVASGARIVSGSNQADALTMSACAPSVMQRVERGCVRLNKYSCILVNSTVLPNCELGEGAMLGAGSVLLRGTMIPAWEIWAGVPAKKIGYRVVTHGDFR